MRIRRFITCLLAACLAVSGFGGCSPAGGDESRTTGTSESTAASTAADTDAATDAATEKNTDAVTDAATEAVTDGESEPVTEGDTTPPEPSPVIFTESEISGRYPNQLTMTAEDWFLSVVSSDSGVRIQEGRFGEMEVAASNLFEMTLRDMGGSEKKYSSASAWASVGVSFADGAVTIRLAEPNGVKMAVELTGRTDENGISWYTRVTNTSEEHTVMSITYPMLSMRGGLINAFLPERSGRLIENASEVGCSMSLDYPGHLLSMPYLAYWGENSGIYVGVHDPDAGMKTINTHVSGRRAELSVIFPAIGAGNMGNTFDVGGYMRWEAFEGDWYDATLLYADFVHNHANWLPEKGRPDTDEKFKEIAMWLVDYAHSTDLEAALMLRERMGYPIAVHAYSWHEIGFDTYYPHFLPAGSNTAERFRQMQDAGIYVMPYINGVSWGTLDASQGYEVNYDNTGKDGVALYPDGTPYVAEYANPLAVMCPHFTTWRELIKQLVRDMEEQLPIDGVYYDQIAAVAPIPCSNPLHGHVTGGGSYWSDGYNDMILDIVSGRPKSSFYFSESTGEAYVKSFDGLLSWMWNLNDQVPAFPIVYTGYVQMVGRNSDAVGTENGFRYHFGEAMLFGQQPGWCSASQFLSAPESRLQFMKQVVDARMQYIDLFNYGRILRPPVVETELAPVDGYRQVISAVWQDPETGKTVLFLINVSEQATTATVNLYPEEYGVDCESSMEVALEPTSVKVIELN